MSKGKQTLAAAAQAATGAATDALDLGAIQAIQASCEIMVLGGEMNSRRDTLSKFFSHLVVACPAVAEFKRVLGHAEAWLKGPEGKEYLKSRGLKLEGKTGSTMPPVWRQYKSRYTSTYDPAISREKQVSALTGTGKNAGLESLDTIRKEAHREKREAADPYHEQRQAILETIDTLKAYAGILENDSLKKLQDSLNAVKAKYAETYQALVKAKEAAKAAKKAEKALPPRATGPAPQMAQAAEA